MSSTRQPARAEQQPINWDNVAVEAAVMLRLQKATPAADPNQAAAKPQS
jgi:hypothetical protein